MRGYLGGKGYLGGSFRPGGEDICVVVVGRGGEDIWVGREIRVAVLGRGASRRLAVSGAVDGAVD